MKYETIELKRTDQVCLLILNRPERLNALTVQMAHDFKAAVADAVAGGARALVLTGAGNAFCAGGDVRGIQEIASSEGRPDAFFDEPLRVLNEAILLIRQTPVPFIAAVNGVAVGGGCNLALACDLVIAAESAKFNQAFVKIGLVPDCGGTFILPRLVGWKRAAELMFTGDMVTAQRAAEMGMINSVTPDGELIPRVMQLAERLAQAPTAAIGHMKRLLDASAVNDWGSQLDMERKAQIEIGKTKDFVEGASAFLEKRPPRFVGS
jgi:2-(1,2-epoxy-1,2-dihydrophenyl)acetyl-CoA isomerase